MLRKIAAGFGENGGMSYASTLVLANYEGNAIGFGRLYADYSIESAGFDLFSFLKKLIQDLKESC